MKVITMTMRDEKIKKAFIEYLEKGTDERFFQALTNFTRLPYIGVAQNPDGLLFGDLWHTEADEKINWIGKPEPCYACDVEDVCTPWRYEPDVHLCPNCYETWDNEEED